MAELMIDIDDTLVGLIRAIHRLAQDRGLHDGTARMQWCGWESYGCSEQEYWDLWTHFAATGGYVKTPPLEGAAEAVRHLYWEGHKIHIVTARGFMANGANIRKWTPEWFEEWAIPYHTLTFSQNKVAAQQELGVRFDYAIDDSAPTVWALRKDGVDATLMHHEHNESEQDLPRVSDMWEWAHLVERDCLLRRMGA